MMDRFEDSVHRFFDPIGNVAGMVCRAEAPDHVRFDNQTVFLEVWFDRHRTRELSVTIGQCERTTEMAPFDLTDVLRAYGSPDLSQVSVLRGSTVEGIDKKIKLLAGLTEKYALELLQNNREEFLYVTTFRRWASLKYAWERNSPKEVIVGYRALIASPSYGRVESTFDAKDLEVLAVAKQLSEKN
ncbi:MAG: hypothetical protein WB729_16290 [Candidatus Sulfotelmatobacter sp.]